MSSMEPWGPAQNLLAASVARRFHLDGRSKLQIADEYGISRFKVARLLDTARDRGVIEVRISVPQPVDLERSDELRRAHGLKRALVLRADPAQSDVRAQLGALAAELLAEVVSTGELLGLAWGRTVNVTVEALTRLPRCTVVQLCGVYSRMDLRNSSVETVRRAAELAGGEAFPIYAPLVLPDRRTTETLRRQPGVREAFDRFDRITTAVVAIGAWQPGLSTVYDVLDPAARDALGRHGVAAEVAGWLFDAEGRPVTTGLAHHVLAMSVEQLRRTPEVIAVAGGAAKAPAIHAVLRTGLLDTLVTDAPAADALLTLSKEHPASP